MLKISGDVAIGHGCRQIDLGSVAGVAQVFNAVPPPQAYDPVYPCTWLVLGVTNCGWDSLTR